MVATVEVEVVSLQFFRLNDFNFRPALRTASLGKRFYSEHSSQYRLRKVQKSPKRATIRRETEDSSAKIMKIMRTPLQSHSHS